MSFESLKFEGPTRAARARELEAAGVTGAAQELVLDRSAVERHLARTSFVLTAATAYVVHVNGGEPLGDSSVDGRVALLLALEIAGVGGADGIEGKGTARARWAEGFGKGRKQASDGPAWQAALAAAAEPLVLVWNFELLECPAFRPAAAAPDDTLWATFVESVEGLAGLDRDGLTPDLVILRQGRAFAGSTMLECLADGAAIGAKAWADAFNELDAKLKALVAPPAA